MIATLHYRARFARGRKYSGGQGQDFEVPGAFNAPAAANPPMSGTVSRSQTMTVGCIVPLSSVLSIA
jgi:hypothetical protein